MRRSIATPVAVVVIVLGLLLRGQWFALTVIGNVMTGVGLPEAFDQLVDWLAGHPRLAFDIGPWVLICAGVGSLVLTHAAPHAVGDLFQRKRLRCRFDPTIHPCFLETTATPRRVVAPLHGTMPSASNYVDFTQVVSAPHTTISAIDNEGLQSERRKYARIEVSASEHYSLKDCQARLTSIRRPGRVIYNDGPILLPFAPAERVIAEIQNISRGGKEYVDVSIYLRATSYNSCQIPSCFDRL